MKGVSYEKTLKTVSVILSAALTVFSASTVTAAAVTDGENDIEKRELTAYLYNTEDTKKIECLFTPELPDVPYIEATDYLTNVYDVAFTETMNNDGTFTIAHPKSSMKVDVEHDTVSYDSFENFITIDGKSEGTMLDAPFIKTLDVSLEGEQNAVTFDLGKYDIDVISVDNKVYFPLNTINDLFFISYNAAMYVDGNLYFVHMMNEATNPYVDMSSFYQSTARTPEMIEYTYNEFCFTIDTFYGAPAQSKIGKLVEEEGFDKALDKYGDDTRAAKRLLKSDNIVDFIFGVCWLNDAFYDGGHTSLCASIFPPVVCLPFFTSGGRAFVQDQRPRQ